jgi:sugar phosphate isomerase/epimerase
MNKQNNQVTQTQIKVGIFANTFKYPTVEEVMDAVQAHGIEHIEFNMSCLDLPKVPGTDTLPSVDDVDETAIQRVRSAADQRGIKMVSIAGYFNMIHPDLEKRNEGLRQLGVLMRAAQALDIKLIALCTGSRDPENMWRRHPANDDPEAYDDAIASMNKALNMAEEHDLILGFEPEVNLVISSSQKARRFLDDIGSPRLQIIFDGANVFKKGELAQQHKVLPENVELLAGDIVMAHGKDLDQDGTAGHLAAGQGKLDYKLYMGLLKKIGFTGSVLLHGLSEDQVDESLSYVKNAIRASS